MISTGRGVGVSPKNGEERAKNRGECKALFTDQFHCARREGNYLQGLAVQAMTCGGASGSLIARKGDRTVRAPRGSNQ